MQDPQAISSHFKTSSGEIRDLFHLLQTAPVAMAVCKGSSAILEFVNDKALEVWDRRRDEVIGKSIYEIIPEINGSQFERIIRNIFGKSLRQEVKEFELKFSPGGEKLSRYFDFVFDPIIDADKKVLGFTCNATEVTAQVIERKKIEDRELKLQQTIDELELSINAGKIGTWHWDVKKDWLTWSKQQVEMFGIDANEFSGKAADFHRFVIPEDREHVLKASRVDLERNEKLYEFRIRRTDGEIRWIHSRSKTFFNNLGEPVSMTGINIDITEQKLAEQKITESEEKYKKLSKSLEEQVRARTEELREINRQLSEAQQIAQLGNWNWDMKNNEVFWSDEMYRLYGYHSERFPLTFEKALERMLPDDAKKSKDRVDDLINKAKGLFKVTGQQEFHVPPLVYMLMLPNGVKKVLRGISKIVLDESGAVSQMIGTVQDITEHKKAEEDIRIINQQLQEAQQLAQLGYWDWNVGTDEFSWSENLYRMYGLDPSDAMSYQNFIFHVHPDDRPIVQQNFSLSQQKKRFHEFYHRIVTPKGFSKTLHMRGEVLTENGKVISMKGTAQDVTVEKLIEDKLLETNKKLGDQYQFVETILNSSANGITVYDNELRYVKLNHAAIQFLEHDPEDLIGKKLTDIYPEIAKAPMYQSLQQVLRGEYVHLPRYHSPVSGRYFDVHLVPLKDALGKIYGLISSGHDITEHIKNENKILALNETLEQRNEFVEKLINSSLDLVLVIDTDLRIMTVNKKAESVFRDIYKGNIIGRKITDIHPGIINTEPFTDISTALKGEVIIRDKVKSVWPGDKYYEDNYVPLFNHSGEVYAVMMISHDITESIRQVEELRKAIESDKLKSDFIKMASHELKTPVTSIKGYVQLVLSMMKENEHHQLPPLMIKSCLVSVEKQVNKLTRLMTELLDLSRIESGKLVLNYEVFNLNELVIDVVQDLVYTNPRQRINVYHDSTSSVFGDKDRIGQVIVNLLNNAIKYSPDTDKIEVTVHQPKEKFIAVTVKDYGIGIDKREQAKIFERFYRAEGQSEQTYPGFGIGLFIAKEMVQRHNGTISVDSEKGKGSVFTFMLPQFRKK
jgi:PAS domain S-box-containing protein